MVKPTIPIPTITPIRQHDVDTSLAQVTKVMHRQSNPAQYMQERMLARILRHQSTLSEKEELGVQVVGGSAPPFHLREITYSNPDILIFVGVDADGNQVQIMQHHSQMSVVIVSVPKIEESPYRIGFTTLKEA